jgi:hypothetical protein
MLSRLEVLQKHPEFREFDSLGLLRDKTGKFMISKSAFLVKKPIGFFDHRHMLDEAYIRHLAGDARVRKKNEQIFLIENQSAAPSYRQSNFFDSDDISTLDRGRIIHTVSAARKMDVMVQSATSSVVQELDQFSASFKGAVLLHSHIPIREDRTLIITYRLTSLKGEPSKSALRDGLATELKTTQQRINRFQSEPKPR